MTSGKSHLIDASPRSITFEWDEGADAYPQHTVSFTNRSWKDVLISKVIIEGNFKTVGVVPSLIKPGETGHIVVLPDAGSNDNLVGYMVIDAGKDGITRVDLKQIGDIASVSDNDVFDLQSIINQLNALYSTTVEQGASLIGTDDGSDVQAVLDALSDAITAVSTSVSALDVPTEASALEILIGSAADKFVSPDKFRTATAPVALVDAATIAVDLEAGRNFTVTLAGNRTLGNPSNVQAGDSGTIYVVQDATGGRTLALAGNWKPIGGPPTLSGDASKVDVLTYFARSPTEITLSYVGVES